MQLATEQLTSVHDVPPFVVLKMCPFVSVDTANPEKVTYAVIPVGSFGSGTTAVTARGGSVPVVICAKFANPPAVTFLATKTSPVFDPA
jgi:hypothetical protein